MQIEAAAESLLTNMHDSIPEVVDRALSRSARPDETNCA
jgi:hypothetical protein